MTYLKASFIPQKDWKRKCQNKVAEPQSAFSVSVDANLISV